MKKLAIFDLDGTLINSIKDLGIATNVALEKHGFPTHDEKAYNTFVGNGVNKLIERALPECHRDEATILLLKKDFKAYYDLHNLDYTHPYPGIESLLDELQKRDVKIAVASNKYEEAVKHIVTHIFPSTEWAMIAGQREGVPVKPDPSIVFEILSHTGIRKSDVIYIGDSGVDMETARRAGVESVGVTWGFRNEAELRNNYADHIVNVAEEIINLIG